MTCLLCCPKRCSAAPTSSWVTETCWNLASNPSSNGDLRTSVHITRRVSQCLTCICLVVMEHLILLYDDTQHHKFPFSLHQAFTYLQTVITFPSVFFFWLNNSNSFHPSSSMLTFRALMTLVAPPGSLQLPRVLLEAWCPKQQWRPYPQPWETITAAGESPSCPPPWNIT